MITLLYRPLRPPKIHLAGRSNFDPAHYSNLSISTHPPTMLLHHFGFQDLFFFPGHPRGWASLPCWQGEGSIVQFLIQVVKSYIWLNMDEFWLKKTTTHIIYSGLELPQSLASAQPPLQPPLSPPHHHQAQQSSSGTSIAGARPPPP